MYNQPSKKATAISIRRWTVLCRLSVLQSACTSMVMLVRLMPYTLWTLWTPLKVVRPLWQCQVCIIWVTSSHMGFIRGYEFDMSHMVSHISFIPSTWRWAIVGQVNTFRPQCISTRDKDRKPNVDTGYWFSFPWFFCNALHDICSKIHSFSVLLLLRWGKSSLPTTSKPMATLSSRFAMVSHLISPYCHMIGQGPIGPKGPLPKSLPCACFDIFDLMPPLDRTSSWSDSGWQEDPGIDLSKRSEAEQMAGRINNS